MIMASKRRKGDRADQPKEVSLDALLEQNRRGTRRPTTGSDPSLRDGDSSKGSPYWDAEDEVTSDNDVGDDLETDLPLGGPSGGAVGGTPARGRSTGGRVGRGITPSSGRDSTVGSDPKPKRRR
jgi:hypothetical protein